MPHEIALKTVLYEIPGTADVAVRRDIPYGDDGRVMDIYSPPGSPDAPVVVIVPGFPDPGMERVVGCKFKEMGSTVSWARLIAASGMTAVAFVNREPAADLHAVLGRIDSDRIAIWAASGNGPLGLSLLMCDAPAKLKCAVLCYPFTIDLDGSTAVADAAKQWGFTNPCAGKSAADLSQDIPLFLARAGQDAIPGLNAALDTFVAAALSRNLPITLMNHAEGPHSFDLLHDSETTRDIVRQILAFLRLHLKVR